MFRKLLGKARHGRQPRRDPSRREPRRRFIPRLERLERRDVPSCSAFIDFGTNLHVLCSGGPDTVTVHHTISSATVAFNGGSPMSFADNLYRTIAIDGGINGLTTIIRAVGYGKDLQVHSYHSTDTINIGDLNNRVQNIQGTVETGLGPADQTNVNIHDEGDVSARPIEVSRSGSAEYVTFSGSANIYCYFTGMAHSKKSATQHRKNKPFSNGGFRDIVSSFV
jgi:hypothetical protein